MIGNIALLIIVDTASLYFSQYYVLNTSWVNLYLLVDRQIHVRSNSYH